MLLLKIVSSDLISQRLHEQLQQYGMGTQWSMVVNENYEKNLQKRKNQRDDTRTLLGFQSIST